MRPENDKRALKRYLRKSTLGDYPRCFKYIFYISAFSLPSLLASSPHPLFSFFIVLPYLIAFSIEHFLLLKTTAYLAEADKAGELEQLIEDFSNAQPVLADRLRIGDEWLFGQGSRYPAKISDITELRHEPAVAFMQGRLVVTLAQEDEEATLCRYTSKTPFENDIGGLVGYLLKINPNISFDSSLLDLPTHKADALLTSRMASRTIRGRWGTCRWEINGEDVLTVFKGTGAPCNGKSPWEERALRITSARFETGVVLPSDCSGLFAGCASLAKLDDNSWDMSKVRSMRRMFCGCSSLKELTSSSAWDTSKVEDMTRAFDGCSSLDKVFTAGWNTSSVLDMTGLFWDCSSLRFIGLNHWDTSRVVDMRAMFLGCTSLVRIPVSQWDTSQVKDASFMFMGCESLEELNLSLWDTGQLADARNMLDGCASLVSLTLSDHLAELLKGNSESLGTPIKPNVKQAR